jgi:hypothetical protein
MFVARCLIKSTHLDPYKYLGGFPVLLTNTRTVSCGAAPADRDTLLVVGSSISELGTA